MNDHQCPDTFILKRHYLLVGECFSLNCQLLLNFIGDDCFQPEKPMSILMLENDLRTKVDNLKLV